MPNAFRAPGAPDKGYFENPLKKVDWFGAIYDRMRRGIVRHPYHVTAGNLHELAGADIVFVAIDDSDARKVIIEGLIELGISFIDVGMDIDLNPKAALRGICRVTVGTSQRHEHVSEVVPLSKGPDSGPIEAAVRPSCSCELLQGQRYKGPGQNMVGSYIPIHPRSCFDRLDQNWFNWP